MSKIKKTFEIHPLANLLPRMTDEEFKGLVADIKKNGQIEPITIHEGKVLEGRHRYLACEKLGIEPMTEPFVGKDPIAFVMGKNVHRRHMTIEQRRDLAADLLKMNPAKSDRALAKEAKLSAPTIAKIRKEEEGRVKSLHVDQHVDSKGRKQPAHKPKKSKSLHWQQRVHPNVAYEAARQGVTARTVIEASPEVSIEERRAQNAALDLKKAGNGELKPMTASDLVSFKSFFKGFLKAMNNEQQQEAIEFIDEFLKPLRQELAEVEPQQATSARKAG